MPARRFALVLALALAAATLTITAGAVVATAVGPVWAAIAIPVALAASLLVRAAWR